MKESFKLNIIKSFFLVIVYSLILASAVFYYTVDKVVPNVLYKNVIDFELSFDADDALVFLRLPVVNETAKVSRYYVEKSEKQSLCGKLNDKLLIFITILDIEYFCR